MFPTREIAPPAHQRWAREASIELGALQERFREWVADIGESEELFKRFVYENTDASDNDFRNHRLRLCRLMAEGETLALDFLIFMEGSPSNKAAVSFVKHTDEKLTLLRLTFFQWHGPIEGQTDIPREFIEGMRDLESGKVVDMELALTQPPPGA